MFSGIIELVLLIVQLESLIEEEEADFEDQNTSENRKDLVTPTTVRNKRYVDWMGSDELSDIMGDSFQKENKHTFDYFNQTNGEDWDTVAR